MQSGEREEKRAPHEAAIAIREQLGRGHPDLASCSNDLAASHHNLGTFQLTAIDQRPGAEAAQELGMTVARVFIAKHRVQRMLEEEMRILSGEPA